MRTDSDTHEGQMTDLHFHGNGACHGAPTLEECLKEAVANHWIGKVLMREDVYPNGKLVKCYSLVTMYFDHYAKQGRFVAEVYVASKILEPELRPCTGCGHMVESSFSACNCTEPETR